MISNIKNAWEYFIYHPDKTEVIVQIYFLNPVNTFFTKLVFSIINFVRSICLWYVDK